MSNDQWFETLDEAMSEWQRRGRSGPAAIDLLGPFALESVEVAERLQRIVSDATGGGYYSYMFRTFVQRAKTNPVARVKPEPPAPKPEKPKRVRPKKGPAVPYSMVPQHLQRADRWVVVRFSASVADEFDGKGMAVMTGASWTAFILGLLEDVEWPRETNLNNLSWKTFESAEHYLNHFKVIECSRPEADRLKEFMGGSETGLIAWIEGE